MSKKVVYEPSFFEGATVNNDTNLDTMENWLMEGLSEEQFDDFVFVHDGAPPYWSLRVRQLLNATLRDRWIGRSDQDHCFLMSWPASSADLTPCDFFLWWFLTVLVYVPPLPKDVDELKSRITEAVATIDNAMLKCVWRELDNRLDGCRVTNCAHYEYFTENLRLRAFRIYQMRCCILKSFGDIQCQNVSKTFVTPYIVASKVIIESQYSLELLP